MRAKFVPAGWASGTARQDVSDAGRATGSDQDQDFRGGGVGGSVGRRPMPLGVLT